MQFLPVDIIPRKTMRLVEKLISIVLLIFDEVFPQDSEKIKKNVEHGTW